MAADDPSLPLAVTRSLMIKKFKFKFKSARARRFTVTGSVFYPPVLPSGRHARHAVTVVSRCRHCSSGWPMPDSCIRFKSAGPECAGESYIRVLKFAANQRFQLPCRSAAQVVTQAAI
jgi:hypothetical protein